MIWIIVQAVLFALIILLPFESQLEAPNWLVLLAHVLSAIGFIVLLRAAYDLRKSLAISPTPKEDGQLQTKGIYGYIRHPMYLSVWLILGGGIVRSGSYAKFGLFAVLVIFFIVKTLHEEKLLRQKYPGYGEYMQKVGGFLPKIR